VSEFAVLLRQYGVGTVLGDRYAGEWPRERFRPHGVEYSVARRSKAELYAAVLPLLNSGRVELLEEPRLVAQLCGLERRTARGGRDSIDHPPGSHDDLANAAAGVIAMLTKSSGFDSSYAWVGGPVAVSNAEWRPARLRSHILSH